MTGPVFTFNNVRNRAAQPELVFRSVPGSKKLLAGVS